MIGAHDFPYIFPGLAREFLTWPWLWNAKDHDGLGVNTISTLWGWLQELLYGGLARLGFDWTFTAILFGVALVVILGSYSIGGLLKTYGLSGWSLFWGRALFLGNTYLILLVDGGQLNLAVAYSLLPLVIAYSNNFLAFMTVTLAISFLDFRVLYLIGLLMVGHAVFNWKEIKRYMLMAAVSGIFLLGAHAYWLLPAILSRAPALPATYTRTSQVGVLSFANISHTLSMMQPHWWQNNFGQTSAVRWYFWVVPIIAFLPLVFHPKSRNIGFWALIGIISAFLAKGSQEPLPGVYGWLFQYVPGWNLFRDPAKFFFLVALSYSVLWGFAAQRMQKTKWAMIALVVYLSLVLYPVFTGQMTGLLSVPRNSEDYRSLANFLEQAPEGKILWIPNKPPLGYSDPNHLSINATTLVDRRPFAVGVMGSYDTMNFLREATYSGELLSSAGVRYLGFAASDPLKDSQKPEDLEYKRIFPNQIEQQSWVEQRRDFGDVTLLQLQTPQPLIYLATKTAVVIGGDHVYSATSDLPTTAYIFAEERPELISDPQQFPHAQTFANSELAKAAIWAKSDDFIFPATVLPFSPDNTGWWKRETSDLIWWRGFLASKYNLPFSDFDFGGGWAVAEGDLSLNINVTPCQSKCTLLIRALSSNRGGKIVIESEDNLIGSVNTFSTEKSQMEWQEVGEVSQAVSQLTLKTQGDINVVNALLMPQNFILAEWKTKAVALPNSQHLSLPGAQVSWEKINPTRYSVHVSGLIEPATLVFAQNYDSLWRLDNQIPVPVNSWLNGFVIARDGTYVLDYEPQKYVWPGLALSGVTLLVIVGWWVLKSRAKL